MTFKELNLTAALMQGIDEAGFVECTPVQERTFREVLGEGRDVTVQSQTGTGKTAAFLISIYEIFSRSGQGGGASHRALIVVPTRELAVQVEEEAKLLGAHLPYAVGSVFGGVGYNQQERLLEQGAEIIIGTPGRLLDFASSRKLDFRQFDTLILDEADRMLDMGFLPDVRRILRALPPPAERHTMLFSATLSTRVKHLAWEFMNNPIEIEIAPEHVTVDEITQELYHVAAKEKMGLLLGLLNRDKPRNALIFTNMKSTAVQVAKRLTHNGMPAEFIMGDLPQRKRLALIEGIKEGRIRYLVATDVAARGLHIDDLDLVVNFDIPEDPELYVHRIGRTARAGNTGKAISLACERYVYGLSAIESFIGQKIPVVWAGDDLYARDSSAGMRFSTAEVAHRGGERTGGRRPEGRSRRGGERSATQRGPGSRAGGSGRPGAGRPVGGPSPAGAARPGDAARAGEGAGARGSAPRNEGRRGGAPGSERSSAPSNRGGRPAGKSGERFRSGSPSRGASNAPAKRPDGGASLEDRVSYYRSKYGEDFKVEGGQAERSRMPPAGKARKPAPDKARKPQAGPGAAPKAPKTPDAPQPAKPSGGLVSKLKSLFRRRQA